jgi:hypothetical protein
LLTQENAAMTATITPFRPRVSDLVDLCLRTGIFEASGGKIHWMVRKFYPDKPMEWINAEIAVAIRAGKGNAT